MQRKFYANCKDIQIAPFIVQIYCTERKKEKEKRKTKKV